MRTLMFLFFNKGQVCLEILAIFIGKIFCVKVCIYKAKTFFCMCDAEKVGFTQLNFYSMLKYAYSLTKHYLVGFLHLNNQRYNFIMNDKKVLSKGIVSKIVQNI